MLPDDPGADVIPARTKRKSPKKKRIRSGKPEKDDGCAHIAHELMEALARADLTKREHSVLYMILDKCYGWGKKEDWLSLSQLVGFTGLSKSHCSDAVRGLLRKNVIIRKFVDNQLFLGPQKYYRTWTCLRTGVYPESGTQVYPVAGTQVYPESGTNRSIRLQKHRIQKDDDERAHVHEGSSEPERPETGIPTSPSDIVEPPAALWALYLDLHPTAEANQHAKREFSRLCRDHAHEDVEHFLRQALTNTKTTTNAISYLTACLAGPKKKGGKTAVASEAEQWLSQYGLYRALKASGRNLSDRKLNITNALHDLGLSLEIDPALDDCAIIVRICRALGQSVPDFVVPLSMTLVD